MGLIDAHNHLPRGLTLETLTKLMDEANVAKTVLMTVYYGAQNPQGQGISDENLVLEFYKARPDRIIPFLGMQRPVLTDPKRWQEPDSAAESLLTLAEARLKTGLYRGMGEFILGHYPYLFPSGARGGTVKIPADTPLMRRFLYLAAKYRVPMTVHYEIDAESLPPLEKMLEYGRQTTIILAHNCGRPDPATLKALLDKHPNLFCDLGSMNPSNAYGRTTAPTGEWVWFVKNPISDSAGRLRPEWKALYEQYADRFVGIGLDAAHPEAWTGPQYYGRVIAEFRRLLADLTPETAEKIGFKNAHRLLVPAPTPTPTPTLTPTPAAGAPKAEELRFSDVHSHTERGLDLEVIIARMNASGVQKIVLFARRGGTDEEVVSLYVKYPQRVVPAVGFQNQGWLDQAPRFLDQVEAKLKTGPFRWMGELLLRHYGVPELQAAEYDISPDTALFRRVLDLSARYGIPVTIHHEAEPGNVETFRRVLRHNLDALVVWSHWCGRATPEVARSFLAEFPNLYCDLGASTGRRYAEEKNPLVGPTGALQPEWRLVIEAFPDRFLAAMDAVDPSHYNQYEEWVTQLKKALGELPFGIAQRVAFDNAERLLTKWKEK